MGAERPLALQQFADGDRVLQVVNNLVSNAIKFTPRTGQVTLRAKDWADEAGRMVRIEIEDNGAGISPEDQKRIFEFAGWRLDVTHRQLYSAKDALVPLRAGEFDLLLAFVERPQRVLSRGSSESASARAPRSSARRPRLRWSLSGQGSHSC